jgi:outer membrane biosynthesis protein TonB
MQQAPDTGKNTKALVATLVWHGALLLFLIFVGFKLPQPPPPPPDQGIEVNLGNSDQGSGTEQPLAPGEPAPEAKAHAAPVKAQAPTPTQPPIETNDNNNDEETSVTKPKKPKVTPKPEIKETAPKPSPKVVMNPAPPVQHPKAVFKGGTGTGGNNQDAFNKSQNEGIAGGQGDQGNPNGDPNSKNYTGNGGTGHSGAAIVRGLVGRTFSMPSFQRDFKENAKIAVDLKVDRNGHVISKSYPPRGSTASNGSQYADLALELAGQLKFNASNVDEQTGTIIFSFRVTQ